MPPSMPAMVKVKMPRTATLTWPSVPERSELLEVFLDEGDECAIDNANGCEGDHPRGDMDALGGEDAEGEAQDGVEAQLADEDHDGGSGGFGDGICQPAVEREDGDLYREGEEEGERCEPESGGVAGDAVRGCPGHQDRNVEGAGLDVEPEDGDQQDGRRDEGVEEVLDGCPAAVFGATEGGDKDGHGNECQLPEGVVEEEVEGDEDAEHRGLLQEEEDVEGLLALRDGVPGDEDAKRGEEPGEHDEPERKAIDAEVVADGG